jgi:hypothetical protein
MSARRLLALLVVVALGLLLVCPTALSRSTLSLTNVTGSGFTTNPDDDDEDPDIPNGYIDGDDDNWDKPGTKGHTVAERLDGNSGAGTGADTNRSEYVLSRMEISLSVRLALLLQSWVTNSFLR